MENYKTWTKRQLIEKIEETEKYIKKLVENEKTFKTLSNLTFEGILIHDNGVAVNFNKTFLKIFGYEREEIIGKNTITLLMPKKYYKILKKSMSKERSYPFEIEGIKKDGTIIPIEIEAKNFMRNDKKLRVVAIRDISKRKNVEKALRIRDKKQKLFLKNSPLGIIYYNNKGIITEINDKAVEIFGSSRKKLIGLSINENPNKKFVAEVKKSLNRGIGHYEGEYTSITGGKHTYIIANWIHIKEGDEIVSGVGLIQDITKDKLLEENLSRLATVVEQAEQTIVVTDLSGNIVYVNPSFEKTTGYKKEEAIGKNPRILKGNRHDEDFYRELWEIITAGKTWHGEFFNKKKDGSYYYERAIIFPVKNEKGEIVNYAAVKQDITNEKRLRDQLQQVQKMEAIGTLAGGIAHDFNNILGVIMGYSELIMDEAKNNPEIIENTNIILRASERAKNMIKQILTFGPKDESMVEPVCIKDSIKETIKFLRASIPSTIEIKSQIDENCGKILANETQINQILLNLCTNAVYAMKETGGLLKISLKNINIKLDNLIGDLPAGKYQLIQVRDTGKGIENNLLNKIFEPYFTTKRKGEGTGMGLAIAYGIVEQSGGKITVQSIVGKGTTFNVYIPLIKESNVESKEINDNNELNNKLNTNMNMLLIDDEEDLIILGKKILEKKGYRVTAMSKSIEALKIFKENPQEFDLIITDNMMPKLTGVKLSEKIHKINPELPIILLTGYSETEDKENFQKYGIRKIIKKPIERKKLLDTIGEVIGSKGL